MNVKEIKAMAKGLGIIPGKLKKAELIQAIQVAESNQPCFGLDKGTCKQKACLWRDDCLK